MFAIPIMSRWCYSAGNIRSNSVRKIFTRTNIVSGLVRIIAQLNDHFSTKICGCSSKNRNNKCSNKKGAVEYYKGNICCNGYCNSHYKHSCQYCRNSRMLNFFFVDFRKQNSLAYGFIILFIISKSIFSQKMQSNAGGDQTGKIQKAILWKKYPSESKNIHAIKSYIRAYDLAIPFIFYMLFIHICHQFLSKSFNFKYNPHLYSLGRVCARLGLAKDRSRGEIYA